jgi:hypothetical protein
MDKSEVMFSKHTPINTQQDIQTILPMRRVPQFSKYLGMPTQMARSKRQTFDYIQDRIWKKISGWKENIFLLLGEVLLSRL